MRVIAGKYKRYNLVTVDDLSVRPVMDRVKEYIFNVLQHDVVDATVCDIFAGSGAIGIEAISRGAEKVTFIELQNKAIQAIETNIEKLNIRSQCLIQRQDAMAFVRRTLDTYDLVFCDPPYQYEDIYDIVDLILKSKLIKPYGKLIIEHYSKIQFDKLPPGWHIIRDKKFGKTIITMIGREDEE